MIPFFVYIHQEKNNSVAYLLDYSKDVIAFMSDFFYSRSAQFVNFINLAVLTISQDGTFDPKLSFKFHSRISSKQNLIIWLAAFKYSMFIFLYQGVLTCESVDEISRCNLNQMKATEQYVPVVLFIILYKVTSTIDIQMNIKYSYLRGCSNSLFETADLAVNKSRKASIGARQMRAIFVMTLTTLN